MNKNTKKYKKALEDIKQDGFKLRYKYVQDVADEEICLAAVKNDGYALEYVSPENQTQEICLAAVKQDGYALRYVSPENQTPEICLVAVKQYADALRYVSPTKELVEGMLKLDPYIGDKIMDNTPDWIKYFPEDIRDAYLLTSI